MHLYRAKSAAELAQSASSKDDWALIASRWQQAIDSLKRIPKTSADHKRAQAKISEYSQNLATAQHRQSVPNVTEPQMVVQLPVSSPQSGTSLPQQQSPQQPLQAEAVTARQFAEAEYLDRVVNRGDSGELLWCAEREILASSLFSPRSYQVLDVSEYGNMASVRVQIESSNRGGSPIIVN